MADGLLIGWAVTPIRRLSAVVLGFAFSATLASAEPASHPAHTKIDRGLREALKTGAATHSVIISVQPGYRATMRRLLEQHGDRLGLDNEILDSVAGEVHAGDIDQLASLSWVDAVSLDATEEALLGLARAYIGDGDRESARGVLATSKARFGMTDAYKEVLRLLNEGNR